MTTNKWCMSQFMSFWLCFSAMFPEFFSSWIDAENEPDGSSLIFLLIPLPTEHGRFVPGRRDAPGFLHRCLPEQQEAGPLETGEDREAAGDGAAGPGAPPGVCFYLTISGCVGGRQRLVLRPPRRGRRQLLPRRPAEEEAPAAPIPVSPESKSSASSLPPVSRLLPGYAVPADSSPIGPTFPQRFLRLPEPLSISVPPRAAAEALPSPGPAARLHHAVKKHRFPSEGAVRAPRTSPSELPWEHFYFPHCRPSRNKTRDHSAKKAAPRRPLWSHSHQHSPKTLETGRGSRRCDSPSGGPHSAELWVSWRSPLFSLSQKTKKKGLISCLHL